MAIVRHGRARAEVDPYKMARGIPVKMQFEQENGEFITVHVKGTDILGLFFKMIALMSGKIDELQRELERVQA